VARRPRWCVVRTTLLHAYDCESSCECSDQASRRRIVGGMIADGNSFEQAPLLTARNRHFEVDATTRVEGHGPPPALKLKCRRSAGKLLYRKSGATSKIKPPGIFRIYFCFFFSSNAPNRQCSPSFPRLATAFCWSRQCVS
jgi:hypothetical protein